MSSIKDNDIYKKTSFLAGVNSRQIEELYTQYLENPSSLTSDWRNFFQGLGDEEKNIIDNSNGPSWSRKKTIKIKIDKSTKINLEKEYSSSDLKDISVTQAAKDFVRAIMLIRAYRIRGHLIANLDPLDIQQRDEHPELKPETYGFNQKDHKEIFFLMEFLDYKGKFKYNFKNLKRKLIPQILVMNLCIWEIHKKKLG